MKGVWDPILCHHSGLVFLQLCVCWGVSGGYADECAVLKEVCESVCNTNRSLQSLYLTMLMVNCNELR